MRSRELLINLAPTGMVPMKSMTPHVPVTAEEIIADAVACARLGVAMVHVHARQPDGQPSSLPEDFAPIIAGIRARCPELVIVATTSGRIDNRFETRSAVLDLEGLAKPDMASLTLGSLNFMGSASVNPPDTVRRLAVRMAERGIKPELEVFDLGMLNYARYLIEQGVLQPPFYFNILLGNIASAQATLLHLAAFMADLPEDSVVSVAGLGRFQLPVSLLGLGYADGVRIGLEDNLWFDEERTRLATNALLVERLVALAELAGRPLMSAPQLRERLKLGV